MHSKNPKVSMNSQETCTALNSPPTKFVRFSDHLSLLNVPFFLAQIKSLFISIKQNEMKKKTCKAFVSVSDSMKIYENKDMYLRLIQFQSEY